VNVSTTEVISLVAMLLVTGGVATYLIQWVKRSGWGSRPKWLLSIGVSAVFGLATAWLAGDVLGLLESGEALTAAQVFAFIGTVYATATGFYELWVKPRAQP
jgi:hypothetical protein